MRISDWSSDVCSSDLICSCFSMTEPQAGADPKEFTCTATRDGDGWVINGEKWYSSNARYAAFLIVMAITHPDNKPHERMSRSEEHTSELQSLMRISYAVFCLKKKTKNKRRNRHKNSKNKYHAMIQH